MTAEEEQNNGEGKGFAGLASLVSDVDTALPPADKKEPTGTSGASTSNPRPTAHTAQPQPSQPQSYREPPQPSSGSSGGKWVFGIAAVIGVLWLIGQSNKSTTAPSPTYTPSAQSTAPSYSQPAQPQAPAPPQESKPTVGQGLVLSTAQIKYCLAEDIRIDGARSALNSYSDSDVDQFNVMVADYNSRCGNYRYRSGALESARREIEPYRAQLKAEGRSRFASSSSTGTQSTQASSQPAPDTTVQAIQRKLNELGYDVGPADGLMGKGTRSAVVAFQQDQGMPATGAADQALLLQLQQAPRRPQTTTVDPLAPTPTQSPSTALAIQPQPETSGRMPDISAASQSEQASIERACRDARQYLGPGDYYNCLRTELRKLSASGEKPDLSAASQSEQASIERACRDARQYLGPGDYYNCLRREVNKLR